MDDEETVTCTCWSLGLRLITLRHREFHTADRVDGSDQPEAEPDPTSTGNSACPRSFDTPLAAARASAFSVKHGLVGILFGPSAEAARPMWVADMDLPCCEAIRLALVERCSHPTFGYTYLPSDPCWTGAARWLKERQGWRTSLVPDNFVFSSSVVTSFFNLVNIFTSPSDRVLVTKPTPPNPMPDARL
jgi:hypothetical protein